MLQKLQAARQERKKQTEAVGAALQEKLAPALQFSISELQIALFIKVQKAISGAKLFADLGAGHAGQPQIHQDQVGLAGDGLIETVPAVAGNNRAKAVLLQHHGDGVAQGLEFTTPESRL